MRRVRLVLALSLLMLPGEMPLSLAAVSAATEALDSPPTADFNRDGHPDLAIGVPGESVREADSAGAVNVVYGSSQGPSIAGNETWTQGTPEINGLIQQGDRFGWDLVAADFNGDRFADLAVGVPFDHVGNGKPAGAVNVLYGSGRGLSAGGNQRWTQDSPGVRGRSRGGDRFGWTLAVGHFDSDRFADLAVGAPDDEAVFCKEGGGTVTILYGSPNGLTAAGNQQWSQRTPGMIDDEDKAVLDCNSDGFGAALAAGNFGRGGRDDLAIGAPGEDMDVTSGTGLTAGFNAGAVTALYGSSTGLRVRGNQFWTQDTPGVKEVAEGCDPGSGCNGDQFGSSLASANLGRGSPDDLAIGSPGETVGKRRNAGGVAVLYGSRRGLIVDGNQAWTQNTPGVPGIAEGDSFGGDQFGYALSAANMGRGLQADLAVGVPFETVNGELGGAVNVLYGSDEGLLAAGSQLWSQATQGIADKPEGNFDTPLDFFGYALSAADHGRRSTADLVIGVPGEDVGGTKAAGAVHLLYGSATGIVAARSEFWHQDVPGVIGQAENEDRFGAV